MLVEGVVLGFGIVFGGCDDVEGYDGWEGYEDGFEGDVVFRLVGDDGWDSGVGEVVGFLK